MDVPVRKGVPVGRRIFFAALVAVLTAQAATKRSAILERATALSTFAAQQVREATPEILAQAEKIAQGTVFFYGRTPVEVGLKDIDWSGSHIRHQEWPAQLNRFFHLGQLASAYRATHQERFAQAARAYIEDWIRGDRYQSAAAFKVGDSGLNMAIRLGTSVQAGWGGTLPVFLGSPAFDDAFVDEVLDSVSRQAEFLSHRLTATGNWRIAELDALVFTALRFPFLSNAQKLLDTGVVGMRNALATQFLPDGVHIERAPGYADWMTQVAANYVQLGRLFPQADARVDAESVVRALDYGAQSELFGVNDSTAPHRDPKRLSRLAVRAELLQRLKLDASSAAQPPLEQVFPQAGQVFLRTEWKPGADYLAFDASTWGGGHSHLSRLSFVFRSKGRMLVADPGILNYEMSDPLGSYGKSTPAHSTLNVGGGNQSGADAQLLRTEFTAETALIQARYQGGYWQGQYRWAFNKGRASGAYGDHERILFWVKGQYILVLDSMSADAGAEIRNCWQLGPMDGWSHDPLTLAWWSRNPDVNLLLELIVPPATSVMRCFEGSRAPLRGWVGFHGNDAVAAPLVEFQYPAGSSNAVLSAVLLAAFSGQARPNYTAKVTRDLSRGTIHHLELGLPDGSTDHIAWTNGLALPVDDGQPFTTDGTFLWHRTSAAGQAAKCFVLDGSYLKHNDVLSFDARERKARLFVPGKSQ